VSILPRQLDRIPLLAPESDKDWTGIIGLTKPTTNWSQGGTGWHGARCRPPTNWSRKEIQVARQRRGGTKKVRKVMREYKTGTLKSSSGAKVRKRKQAIAIALSEARQAGAKIPKKKAAAKKRKETAAKR